ILGELTSKLQSLDVAINKSFKSKMASTIHQLTLAGCLRKPSYATLAQWIDGMEDDMVFDYESLSENLTGKNDENFEVVNLDNINGKEYEEVPVE
ncbi:9696_t:CDS:2, partial [Scutellospora calospora]